MRFGFFYNFFRQIQPEVHERIKYLNWVVIDGDVEKDWTAPMGGMLAEMENLLMTNRTKVELNYATSIIVETESIGNADPVFVTRSGIINIRDEFQTPQGIF